MKLHLLIDADDTLWENHAWFLRILARFDTLMAERGHPADRVEATLSALEHERTRTHGYGSAPFAESLVLCYEAMNGTCPDALRTELLGWGEEIRDHPIVPFEGVPETLAELRTRHHLHLVTKGQAGEQRAKVERSGLAPCFESVHVLAEKDPARFAAVLKELGADPGHSWMIGNSPRSDMNPAGAVGLRTCFIPHRTIWSLEDAAFDRPPDLELSAFSELRRHF